MIIGVTGGLGTGTSTVARCLASGLKAKLIDADKIARNQVSKNASLVKQIVSGLGKELLDYKGNIDRTKLAKKAFANRYNHKKLCDITYPVIITEIDNIRRENDRIGISDSVVDAPMLIESGFYKKCDLLVVVTSSLALQLERAWVKKKIRNKDALSRVRLQMDIHKKKKYADYVIDNSSTLAELREKCREIISELKIKNKEKIKWL